MLSKNEIDDRFGGNTCSCSSSSRCNEKFGDCISSGCGEEGRTGKKFGSSGPIAASVIVSFSAEALWRHFKSSNAKKSFTVCEGDFGASDVSCFLSCSNFTLVKQILFLAFEMLYFLSLTTCTANKSYPSSLPFFKLPLLSHCQFLRSAVRILL